MSDSILNTIKKPLGLDPEYTAFDDDIKMHINSIIWKLRQLGVGVNDFVVTGPTETWEDYLGEDERKMEIVKSFIWMSVRLMFDPPTNASLYAKYDEMIKEYESRIVYDVDPRYE